MKVGDTVNFMFQGKWGVNVHGRESSNIGKVTAVSGDNIEVTAPNGARYYLSRDMVRKLGEVERP